MTPQRWQQIDALLEKALDQRPEDFETILAESCLGDESLRREVESLMKYRKLAESFLEVPALEAAAELISESGAETTLGRMIGPYLIESQLGTGGMAEVYLAEDTKLDRKVAIKFLPVDFETDELAKKRLIREAKAAAKLDHPNICSIHEIGEVDGRSFIVMQYVEGETLASRLERSALTLRETSEIAFQVADALAEAHSRGIVHRDIKPQNVMITPRGQVKVLDFGLAKLFEVGERSSIEVSREMLLSVPGSIIGTAYYMSPEQARGLPVDARADLFSLGVMLYECVTGKRPFSGTTGMEIRAEVIHVHPQPPSQLNHEVPPLLDTIILKALAKDVGSRYQSAGDLGDALRRVRAKALSEDEVKTQPIAEAMVPWKPALSRVATVLGRPQVWIPSALAIVVAAAAMGILPGLRKASYVPTPDATYWYEAGITNLRDGAYYQASKAFQQAVAKDDKFALAHARLAEAYTELDYADKANQEVLRARALVPEPSSLPPLDSLYLQAITQTVLREFAPAVESYKEILGLVTDSEKPQAYLDLGRAYEKNSEFDNAKQSYQKAIQLSPSDAASTLRLGVLCGQLKDNKCADEAFQNAEKLYLALSSQEGVTEVFYQRGFLNIVRDPEAARIQLERALELSNTTHNVYQQIRTLLSLSSVAVRLGGTGEAEPLASRATSLAQAQGIENQATEGLIWLGNSFFARGDFGRAEKYYQQSLELARRDNGRRNEALALVQLGSLRTQQRNTVEGLRYIEQGLTFFRQPGYGIELSQILILRGRAMRDAGDYNSALTLFNEQLQLGEQARDTLQMATVRGEIGSVLTRREEYPTALHHFEEGYRLSQSSNVQLHVGFAALHRAEMLWQLGDCEGADGFLNEATQIAEGPGGPFRSLLASVLRVRGQMEASKLNFAEAQTESVNALTAAGREYQETIILAKLTLGLVHAKTGEHRAATVFCEEALDLANSTDDPFLISNSWLGCAEMLLASRKFPEALEKAFQAQQAFSRSGQLDSEWRAWLIAARARQQLGNAKLARECASNARDIFTKFEQRLGSKDFQGYLSRKDIQDCQQQLNQVSSLPRSP
jgi:tetratricopeptide (TPR) repeat protein